MIEWIKQYWDILACLIAGTVPAIVAVLGLRFKLSNRVTRLQTLLEEHIKHEHVKLQFLELQRMIDQLQRQLNSQSGETISASRVDKLSSSIQEVKRLLIDDLKSHSSGLGKNTGMSPSGTQGQTGLSIPIEEIPNPEDSKAKKKRPKREKKADTNHKEQV